LHSHIQELLEDDEKRQRLVTHFRKIVLEQHTYSHRTREVFNVLRNQSRKTKIAIKIAAPTLAKSKHWGDLYFAAALRKPFEKEGYDTRIDCMDQWYSGRALGDDVVIVLRGLDRYRPRQDQLSILWMISHPELVCASELREYDKVYVASEVYTHKLQDFTEVNHIEFLPQATEFSTDTLDRKKLEKTPAHDILFIGGSRGEYRETVRWCVEEEMPISVYGQGWEDFIPERYIVGKHIENSDIPYFYQKAKVVLNDHWPDMRRLGFISNRIWDVLGAGGTILTDFVVGIDSLESKNLHTFSDREEFLSKLQIVLNSPSQSPENFIFHGTTPFFSGRVATISSFIENNL
jgi:O-antigen biosynthesis protein